MAEAAEYLSSNQVEMNPGYPVKVPGKGIIDITRRPGRVGQGAHGHNSEHTVQDLDLRIRVLSY
jgi:hypothetical protein